MVLDENIEAFILHNAFFNLNLIYATQKAQIFLLFTKKAFFSAEYLDFEDMFSKKSVIKKPKSFSINTNTINLKKSNQPLY